MKGRLLASVLLALPIASGQLRVATFRSDVTPALGEPLIWTRPAGKILDPLWAKGIIIDDGTTRYVLCAVDWCGVSNSTHLLFRSKLAAAARAAVSHVVVTTVHQHTAPYIDGDAYLANSTFPRMSERFLNDVTDRLARAAREARFEAFDGIGAGQGRVESVASARRILSDGKVITRYSTSGKDAAMAALPEGLIDPWLKTVTLAEGGRALVRLHYYATHPQTFCCDGNVSGDFVSSAREALERKENIFQIYFTGCSGDVTVGKYNDGSEQAREGLALRLEQAMGAAIASSQTARVTSINWRMENLVLPRKQPRGGEATPALNPDALYKDAITTAFARRKQPLEVNALDLGPVTIVHLPGEPMLEFQRYAQGLRPGRFVAVAGYGDLSPGYLCTDKAFAEGGYEPGASNSGPGAEARVKKAIRKVMLKRRR